MVGLPKEGEPDVTEKGRNCRAGISRCLHRSYSALGLLARRTGSRDTKGSANTHLGAAKPDSQLDRPGHPAVL